MAAAIQVAALLVAAVPNTAATVDYDDKIIGWAELSVVPSFHSDVRISFGTSVARSTTVQYWARRSSSREATEWTDSRRCPALRQALDAMRRIAMPSFTPPGFDVITNDIVLIGDGTQYTLRAPAKFDDGIGTNQLTLTSHNGTALARWADRTMDALEPCWSGKPPLQ